MDDYLDEALAYDSSNGPTPPKQGRLTPENNQSATKSESFNYKSYSPKKGTDKKKVEFKTPQKILSSKKNVEDSKTPQKSEGFKSPHKLEDLHISEDLPTHVIDGESILPLTHTVSFYRKTQNQATKTPVKQVIRNQVLIEETEENISEENELVQKKIQELTEEVGKQQMVISQASQALNLCNSTPEFSGSTEQVEAEKLLLLASKIEYKLS